MINSNRLNKTTVKCNKKILIMKKQNQNLKLNNLSLAKNDHHNKQLSNLNPSTRHITVLHTSKTHKSFSTTSETNINRFNA